VYIGEPNLADRRKILGIHLKYMPLDGSKLEELIEGTGSCDEAGLDALVEALGKDREVTIEEAIAAADTACAGKEGKLNRGTRRKHLVDRLAQRGLSLIDEPRDELIMNIAGRTEGYVGADMEGLCREAGVFAMRERATSVTLRHFEMSLAKVHPTMNERLREFYSRIRLHFKGGLPREVQPPEYQ
jgi:transitional endoplasmic reticulum ATPase